MNSNLKFLMAILTRNIVILRKIRLSDSLKVFLKV